MLRDTGHELVVDTMNTIDIHSIDHICAKMGVEVTVEDGLITDYNFNSGWNTA